MSSAAKARGNYRGETSQLDVLAAIRRFNPAVSHIETHECSIGNVKINPGPGMKPIGDFRVTGEAADIAIYIKFCEVSADPKLADLGTRGRGSDLRYSGGAILVMAIISLCLLPSYRLSCRLAPAGLHCSLTAP